MKRTGPVPTRAEESTSPNQDCNKWNASLEYRCHGDQWARVIAKKQERGGKLVAEEPTLVPAYRPAE